MISASPKHLTKDDLLARTKTSTVTAASAPPTAGGGTGRPAGDRRVSTDRRAAILKIACSLFAKKGFEATSIREIGDAAGILSGSLYHHFTTKEDMLHEIIKDYVHDLLNFYEVTAKSASNPRQALEEMIRFGISESLKLREVHAIVVNDRKYLAAQETFRYIEDAWQDLFRIWYGVLQEGVRVNLFRADLNLHIVLRIIIDSINSTVMWYRPDGRYSVDEVIGVQVELLFRGIAVPPPAAG
jgi:AcrR family transcriptional regulator